MARITVEDCVTKIPNRFDLVILGAQRARQVSLGAPLTITRDNDKNPVVALREIALGKVNVEDLKNVIVHGYRSDISRPDMREDELDALLSSDKSLKSSHVEIGSSEDIKVFSKK